MADYNLQAFTAISQFHTVRTRSEVELPYELVINHETNSPIAFHLADASNCSRCQAPEEPRDMSTVVIYQIKPDYQTTFVSENGAKLEEEELEQRYPGEWCKAYLKWVEKYTNIYDERYNKPDFYGGALFERPEHQRVWELEGMMFAVWLALQPDVASVEISLVEGHSHVLYGQDPGQLGETFRKALEDVMIRKIWL